MVAIVYITPEDQKIRSIKSEAIKQLVLQLENEDREASSEARVEKEGFVINGHYYVESPTYSSFEDSDHTSSEAEEVEVVPDYECYHVDHFHPEHGYRGEPYYEPPKLTRGQKKDIAEDKKVEKEEDLAARKARREERKLLWVAFHRKLRVAREEFNRHQLFTVTFTSDLTNLDGVGFVFIDFDWDGVDQLRRVLAAFRRNGLAGRNRPKVIALYSSPGDTNKTGVNLWIKKNDQEDMQRTIGDVLEGRIACG